MTTERPARTPEDPFWTDDVQIGQGHFWRSDYAIRLKAHVTTERYRQPQEIVPGLAAEGERVYVLAKPYVLVPDVTVTVGMYPEPDPHNAVGEILESDWTGMKHVEVGSAQAWAYPADATLVLWECLLHPPGDRTGAPVENETWLTVWRGLEAFLLDRVPGTQRIVTPAWDPGYDRQAWHELLRALGYEELSPAAFGKMVAAGSVRSPR